MNDQDWQRSEQSSFTTGFTFGMLAGAVGYFLFGTERGGKLRRQIVAEWKEAQQRLAAEGKIESTQVSLREFLQRGLRQFGEYTENITGTVEPPITLPELPSQKKNTRPSVRGRKSTRFRGVK